MVPSVVQQRSCRESLKPTLRGRRETKLPVYPHKPAEVSHSRPVCSIHILWSHLLWFASASVCVYMCVCVSVSICALKTEWKCVLCQLLFVSFQLPSSASVYVGLWSCVSLPACSRVWVIIPVCWQSRRTEGSVYADLNPLDLSCHLEYENEEREKKLYPQAQFFKNVYKTHMNPVKKKKSTNDRCLSTYTCQGELLLWFVLWTRHRSSACPSPMWPGAWRVEQAEEKQNINDFTFCTFFVKGDSLRMILFHQNERIKHAVKHRCKRKALFDLWMLPLSRLLEGGWTLNHAKLY